MISVIIPTYNEAPVIEETLRRAAAALRAAGEDFEIVVVDDASADGTAELVESLAQRNPRACAEAPGAAGAGHGGSRWMGDGAGRCVGGNGRGFAAPSRDAHGACGRDSRGSRPGDWQPLCARAAALRIGRGCAALFRARRRTWRPPCCRSSSRRWATPCPASSWFELPLCAALN